MQIVKIKDSDSLVRDMSSGVIINTNKVEYQNYLNKRNSSQQMREQIQQNSNEIKEIKSELTEIKQLLISLINKET
jgi:superfamily I DNA and RNA helicase